MDERDRAIARFWAKVNKQGRTVRPELGPCWEWTASLMKASGYGQMNVLGKPMTAHRIAWAITYGDPGEFWVLHKCDNRACARPDHLFLGTHADNMRDCREKGRMATGDRHGAHTMPHRRATGERSGARRHPRLQKLTIEQVREIRAAADTQVALAAKYGVRQSHISRIKLGQSWRWR